MNGLAGRPGWSWIFIIEGAATVVVGLLSFFMVHDFPDEATFLSPEDRARVIRRLKLDNQSSAEHEEFKMAYLWAAVGDWKTWMGMFLYMGPLMPLYSFSLFLPTIISNMGFTTTTSIVKNQLLSVPPYAAACVATLLTAYLSDRHGRRGIYNLILAPISIAGFAMLISTTKPAIQYAGTFLGAIGIYATIPIIIAWIANNTEGVYKRGITLGFVIGWGNMNGIVSSNIFFDSPRFIEGHATIIAYMTVCIFGGSLLMMTLLNRENAKRRSGKRDYLVEGLDPKEIEMLGDNRPDFIYTL